MIGTEFAIVKAAIYIGCLFLIMCIFVIIYTFCSAIIQVIKNNKKKKEIKEIKKYESKVK